MWSLVGLAVLVLIIMNCDNINTIISHAAK